MLRSLSTSLRRIFSRVFSAENKPLLSLSEGTENVVSISQYNFLSSCSFFEGRDNDFVSMSLSRDCSFSMYFWLLKLLAWALASLISPSKIAFWLSERFTFTTLFYFPGTFYL